MNKADVLRLSDRLDPAGDGDGVAGLAGLQDGFDL